MARPRSWRSGSSASGREWRGCRATRPTTTPPRCGPPSPRRSMRSPPLARPRRSCSPHSGGSIGIVPAFVAAIEPIGPPMTIVLDHLEHVSSRESHAALAEFAMRVPRGLAAGAGVARALADSDRRLRAQGRITELGPSELAMSDDEAEALLAGADVDAPATSTGELLERTEGWPVGLYLAALAMQTGTPIGDFAFGGDDRWVGDYLRSELLSRVTPDEARFLLRTSVLDRLCGPLCDAVAGVSGSARILESLVGRNMLVVPLDRHREWYRYHHLLREHLQAELRMQSPDEIPELHSRAAAWYVANGMPEDAIEHAQAAGDADLVGRTHPGAHESGLGERSGRDGAALDAVARGASVRHALCRGDGPRRADLRAARASPRGRAVGGSGRAPSARGRLPARRQHGLGQISTTCARTWRGTAWRRCAARRRPPGRDSVRAARSARRWRTSRESRTCSRVISITRMPSCPTPRTWRPRSATCRS